MDKTTPHRAHSKRAKRGVVLPNRVYSSGLRRRVSKKQALYEAYGGTGVLGLDARVARDKADRLREVDSRVLQGYEVFYEEFAHMEWRYGIVLPPLPEVAGKISR